MKSKYIESNMTISLNNIETVLTITAETINYGTNIGNIIAFTNKGHQHHLTEREEMEAYHILNSEQSTKP